jgi:hypothetical protein
LINNIVREHRSQRAIAVGEEFSPDHKRRTGISMEQQVAAELIASARRKK